MGELIRIGAPEGAPGLGATIDTTGAWVTRLSLDNTPVFLERQELVVPDGRKKVRGGMHPCSPHFGLPKYLVKRAEPQHGYARLEEWSIHERAGNHLSLAHCKAGGTFDGLRSTIDFKVGRDEEGKEFLDTKLTLRSDNECWAISVSPGFHPYLEGLEGFDDLETDVPEVCLEGLSMNPNSPQTINLVNKMGVKIELTSWGLGEAVKWTDRLEGRDYTCIEPVLTTMGLSGKDNPESITLRKGDTQEFDLRVSCSRA